MKHRLGTLQIGWRIVFISLCLLSLSTVQAQQGLRVLNFQGDNGYQHTSKQSGLDMLERLSEKNNWKLVSSSDTAIMTLGKLLKFDVIVFTNNCGNAGRIFSDSQQLAFKNYINNGGGFVGLHCAGAIRHEGEPFQSWFDGLIGTKLLDHPKVQEAKLIIEDTAHFCTCHLPEEWVVKDEWHRFSMNPRENVQVLMSVDEESYVGNQKMNGDHPFTWLQHYDGGRSFFTSLGHTEEIYANPKYVTLVEKGILWAADKAAENDGLPVSDGLMLDLDADYGIQIEDANRISAWTNRVEDNEIKVFVKQDEGRKVAGSGRPRLAMKVPKLNGHNTVVFHQDELLCHDEEAFDALSTGTGYTWFSVMSVYEQRSGVKDVNSFFGNLRNTNLDKKGKFEGFWGGLNDDNTLWMGSRSGRPSDGRWNAQNPQVLAPYALEKDQYYIVMGRMEAGTDTVNTELFVNSTTVLDVQRFSVNTEANPSKMSIGQERDATNHPGAESFDGEISRFLIFDRPLSQEEMELNIDYLISTYNITIND